LQCFLTLAQVINIHGSKPRVESQKLRAKSEEVLHSDVK
jgi:hypothetical protein